MTPPIDWSMSEHLQVSVWGRWSWWTPGPPDVVVLHHHKLRRNILLSPLSSSFHSLTKCQINACPSVVTARCWLGKSPEGVGRRLQINVRRKESNSCHHARQPIRERSVSVSKITCELLGRTFLKISEWSLVQLSLFIMFTLKSSQSRVHKHSQDLLHFVMSSHPEQHTGRKTSL